MQVQSMSTRDGGFYRCSKQAAEHYVEEYQRSYNWITQYYGMVLFMVQGLTVEMDYGVL